MSPFSSCFIFFAKKKIKKGCSKGEKRREKVSRKIRRQDPRVSKLFGLMVHTCFALVKLKIKEDKTNIVTKEGIGITKEICQKDVCR